MCSEKDENFSNGSGIEDKGFSRFFSISSLFGTLSGTFLNPSMSSEKIKSLVGISDKKLKAFITIVVLKTSPKVPMCGSPDGPYPV